MDQIHTAIVLRRRSLSEGDFLLVFLTKEMGRLNAVVRRRSNAGPMDARFEPFTMGELLLSPRYGENLQRVYAFDMIRAHDMLRKDLELFAQASYIAELLDLSLMESNDTQAEFFLLLKAFSLLDVGSPAELVSRWFEMRLLGMAGLRMDLSRCAVCQNLPCGKTTLSLDRGGLLCERCMDRTAPSLGLASLRILRRIHDSDTPKLQGIHLSMEIRNELRHVLQQVIVGWLGLRPKSIYFMETISGQGEPL